MMRNCPSCPVARDARPRGDDHRGRRPGRRRADGSRSCRPSPGFGACGSGGSVINDGCSVAVKDGDSPGLSGRFDPFGGAWIDSQDRAESSGPSAARCRSVGPLRADRRLRPGPSERSVRALLDERGRCGLDDRRAGGRRYAALADVLFDAPATRRARVPHPAQRWLGGGGRVAPIPLPAGGLLLAAGIGSLAGLRRRHRRV